MKTQDIQKLLKGELKPGRYVHTLGVVSTAIHLANVYGEDTKKAELAGLLHDCAKNKSDEELIALCESHNVTITEVEYANPSLLHAKGGAILAEEIYGVTDPEILRAIRVHTTGCCGMTRLDQIIFISDYIEPNRDKAPHLSELRVMADHDLDRTTYRIMRDTVDYLNTRTDQMMDPTTYAAYLYYKNLIED